MMKIRLTIGLLIGVLFLAGCGEQLQEYCQGYIEGEYVYISVPSGGRLVDLSVSKGEEVVIGQKLFSLEPDPQRYVLDQAQATWEQSRDQLNDSRKGQRPHELEALKASVGQADAVAESARLEQERLQPIHAKKYVSDNDYDQARLDYQAKAQALRQARENLAQAKLGSRSDQIKAAAAQVRLAEASLNQARWDLEQRERYAPFASLVFDTLYREGEWVPAGNPVLALLPPENIKVRFFVPQPKLSQIKRGQKIRFVLQGSSSKKEAVIDYISPEVEYTPPVIFSRDNSSKLIYLVEALPTGGVEGLNPGLPVEVFLPGSDR